VQSSQRFRAGRLPLALAVVALLSHPSHGRAASFRSDTLIWNVEDLARVAPLEDAQDQRPVWDSLDASDSPRGAVRRLLGAYAHGWSAEYRSLMSADFRFEFGDPALIMAFTVGTDPAHSDDPARFQIVLIDRTELQAMIGDGEFFPLFSGTQRFALVRGDAAWLDADQPGDADHWYVRSWIENPIESPRRENTWGVIYR